MRTFSVNVSNEDNLLADMMNHSNLFQAHAVLVQLFCFSHDKERAARVAKVISEFLPHSVLIGSTAEGAYYENSMVTEGILVSFTMFQNVEMKPFEMEGANLDQPFGDSQELVLLFNSEIDDEALFEKMKQTPFIGGRAAKRNGSSFVVSGQQILTEGVVGVRMISENVEMNHHSETFWKPAGRSYEVTKALGSRLFEVEGLSAVKFYEKYLGYDAAKRLPESSAYLPLIHLVKGKEKPISVLEKHRDGSVTVNTFLNQGSSLQFSFGDVAQMSVSYERIKQNVEMDGLTTLFSFSSAALPKLLNNGIVRYFDRLEKICTHTSILLESEYYSDGTSFHFDENQMVFAHFNEKHDKQKGVRLLPVHNQEMNDVDGLMALSHLIKASTDELETLNTNLQQSEQRFKSLFEQNPNLVYSVDVYGKITSVNPALKSLLGYSSEEVMSKHSLQFVSPSDVQMTRDKFHQTFQGIAQTYDAHLVHKSGVDVLFTITNIPILINGEITGAYGIAKSIMNQRKAEEKIAHLAYYDVLTELPNRLLFEKLLNESLKNEHEKLAVMFIDLDRFKLINDSLGHQRGDQILKQVTARIKEAIKDDAVLARFGGDEFTVLLPGLTCEKDALLLARRVVEHLKQPILFDGVEYFITVGIGISLFPLDGQELDTLMKNAYIALESCEATRSK
ncbi:diguanylate cyclase domain-containing protein [Bacillus sp. RAR_GA_16]|uniref:diguanylate cyclase domain-containing protein n=1 Tax=Bacillus sp. RAR_GA_16 TaxID=2876774 RepID=UPI001CCC2CF0|nr:diguanylate cyclase [Bacillus sp. RAR_GA_16]MCA0172363.1 diguanylate cyclase [Bacillus sp. RAR_GA_16]